MFFQILTNVHLLKEGYISCYFVFWLHLLSFFRYSFSSVVHLYFFSFHLPTYYLPTYLFSYLHHKYSTVLTHYLDIFTWVKSLDAWNKSVFGAMMHYLYSKLNIKTWLCSKFALLDNCFKRNMSLMDVKYYRFKSSGVSTIFDTGVSKTVWVEEGWALRFASASLQISLQMILHCILVT